MFEFLLEKLQEESAWFTFITIISTLVFLLYKLEQHFSTKFTATNQEIKEILNNQKSIDSYYNAIAENFKKEPSPYRYYLIKVLRILRKYLGKRKLFSYKALDQHILFSLIYSFFFFYLIWLLGGTGEVGNNQLLPNDNKLIITLYLIFEIGIIYFLLIRTELIKSFFSKKISAFSRLSNTSKELFIFLVLLVVIVIIVIETVEIVEELTRVAELTRVVGLVGVVGLLIGGMVKVIGSKLIVGLISVSIGLVIGLVIGGGVDSIIILYLLFFIILPLINAVFDYISMYFSRFYAKKILKAHYKWQISLDFFLDLVIAAILFIGLALTLFYAIEFSNINLIKEKELFIPIEHYKTLLVSGNIWHKDVAWITLMFLSTLLPTLLHFALAFTSFLSFMIFKPQKKKLLKQLKNLEVDNYYDKDVLAKSLTYNRLSFMMKVYVIIAMVLTASFFSTLIIFAMYY